MKKILLTSLALMLCLSAAVYAAPKDKGGDSGSHSSSSNDNGSASSSKDNDSGSSSEDTDSDSSQKNSGSETSQKATGSGSSSKGSASESSKGSSKEKDITDSQASEDSLVEESKVENIQEKQQKLEKLKENKSSQAELKAYADELRKDLSGYGAKEKQNILTSLVETYEEVGDVEKAIDVQEEVIQSDLSNVDAYKKIGKLYEKAGKKGVKAFVNGKQPQFDVPPVIKDGRTLIPIRAISQSLKAEVNWDPTTKTVTITREGVEIKLSLDDNKAFINGQEVTLEVPAGVMNGRTVVPARFISEAFGALVKYESETQSVIIIDQPTEDASSDDITGEEQVNEPTAEEPAVEEPAVGEPAVGEPTVGEPTAVEPTAVEPPVDEPTVNETTVEEATTEEATVDETTLGEVTVDEALIDVGVLQDSTEQSTNP